MHCLLVCPLVSGGICHYTYSLAEALQAAGADVRVLTSSEPEYELSALSHTHTVSRSIRRSGGGFARAVQPIRNMAVFSREAAGVDVIHIQWPLGRRTDPLLWRAARRAGARVVYTAHNVAPHELGNRAEEHVDWLCESSDAVIVHGDALAAKLTSIVPSVASRLSVLPLGNYSFLADRFDRWDRRRARESFGWGKSEKVILFFGLIRRYKGLDTLIDAAAILAGERGTMADSLRLLIAGEDFKGEWGAGAYESQLSAAGLMDRTTAVRTYIPLEDVGRYFHAADVVALPYRSGSQSAVLQAAYAFARPSVVTDVGSVREVVRDGATGLVVPPENPHALASAIGNLLADPVGAERLGRAGREYADSELSWATIAEKTLALYRAAVPATI